MITVVFLMGPTCAGKSTFIDFAKNMLGGSLYAVQVGKIMRERHSIEYFEGSAAPEKTQQEAWGIFTSEMNKALTSKGVSMVFVDGQPRGVRQAKELALWRPFGITKKFVMMHADQERRESRLFSRYPNDSKSFEEGKKRVQNDMILYFDVLMGLNFYDVPIISVNTNDVPEFYQTHLLETLVHGY